MKRVFSFMAVLMAFTLVASACGDDSDEGGSPTTAAAPGTTAAPSDTGSTATGDTGDTGGSDCELSESPKFVGLFEKKGESVAAIDDFAEGSQLAVDEINAAGGVCGQQIDWERLPASPTDGNQAKNQFLAALDKDADVIFGPISTTPMLAIAPEVDKAGVPTLYMSTCPECFTGEPSGSDWSFITRPNNVGIATLQVEYIVETLGKKKIGLSCVELSFGEQGCNAAEAKIKELGGEVVARETNATTAQDLTPQVLAFKSAGVEAVLAFNFPNPIVVLANQVADNELDVPLFGGSSAGIAVASGSVKSEALPNLWGTDDCSPAALADDNSKDFAAKYTAAYGKPLPGAGYAAAESYDIIKLAAAAIEQAGSLDPADVAEALRSIEYEGACTTYKAAANQGMHHLTVIEQFTSEGVPTIQASFDVQ